MVLLAAGGIGWLNGGDPPPYRPGGRLVVDPDGRLVPSPGTPYRPPVVPLPTGVFPRPTDLLPRVPLPSVPLATRSR